MEKSDIQLYKIPLYAGQKKNMDDSSFGLLVIPDIENFQVDWSS